MKPVSYTHLDVYKRQYQTRLLLNDYVMQLMEQGCKLADNCLRTWFFVQNVDVNYAGVDVYKRQDKASADSTQSLKLGIIKQVSHHK